MQNILLIHPTSSLLSAATEWLSRSGFHVTSSDNVNQIQTTHDINTIDLILIDSKTLPDETINFSLSPCPIIVLDQYPTIDKAALMIKEGAQDYLQLPITAEKLLENIINLFDKSSSKTNLFANTGSKDEALHLQILANGIIGSSPSMQSLFSDMQKISGTDVTVLIRGESGTGKELVAKALHNLSHRKNQPLISVNCAAIPENLIESELFGHEKGAFTGAISARDGLIFAANNGTLFLDEIGELPLEAQARLLRVLQEGEIRRVGAVSSTHVNIRLVTATHRNLQEMVSQGLFREDLYYRLYVMELILPPLRERGDDISLIAETLLYKACEKHHKTKLQYTKEFDQAIRAHNWPGNVRELENAIERATILSDSHKIDPFNLKIPQPTQQTKNPKEENQINDNLTLDGYLKYVILRKQNALTETQLAHSLGISRKSLWERRQKLGIPRKVTTKSNT
ncbi:sigma-54 dependent transcriptional regulator [Marinomonas phaeophyticola]|uniref:sigma-54-dependent transcriptional regulator n=1 Tax=Marinomonas phaeophyticola TaxID=3004091 RepID=UPI002E807F82|nr:sigma-54 dependent transcriptional regulator [Marinomonas sp. 15G1-11]